jgi:hypothetical protein
MIKDRAEWETGREGGERWESVGESREATFLSLSFPLPLFSLPHSLSLSLSPLFLSVALYLPLSPLYVPMFVFTTDRVPNPLSLSLRLPLPLSF